MDTKPGKQTTEFWLVVICQVLAVACPFLASQFGESQTTTGIVVGGLLSGLSTAAYTISRGMAKRGGNDAALQSQLASLLGKLSGTQSGGVPPAGGNGSTPRPGG